jgi:hypothetical protein
MWGFLILKKIKTLSQGKNGCDFFMKKFEYIRVIYSLFESW